MNAKNKIAGQKKTDMQRLTQSIAPIPQTVKIEVKARKGNETVVPL